MKSFPKNIKFENIKRTATSNGPFYLLGLMGNSSNVKAEGIEFLEVNSDTGFRAIEIGLPDSTLEVGYIDINNLTAKNGSYLGYSAGISSAGSVTATNEIRISNLEANTDDLFAVYAEGLRKLFKSTLNNRLHRNLACVIDKSSRGAKLERAFEELP